MSKHTIKGSRWDAVAADVKERDGWQCVVCGATEDLTVDHNKPVSLFDEDDWHNERQYDPAELATFCRSCNARKGNRPGPIRVTWLNPRFFPPGYRVPRAKPSFSQNQ